ncbi:MAG: IS5 family transposase [Abditibacteriaceae bacterium]
MSQLTFCSLSYASKKKVTRRESFLQEMETIVPWLDFESLIEPHYPKAGNGRQPMGLSSMLRIYFMQQWFQLSDPGMEDALYDSQSMQRFAGLEVGRDAIPDESTILHFRHLLEKYHLTEQMFSSVRDDLQSKGILLHQGTITDATIIHASGSIKNREKARDKEMSTTMKGKTWHFGMKAHVGVDSKSGLAHTLVCTTASVHDSQVADQLLHGEEKEIYGDKAYSDQKRKHHFKSKGIAWRVSIKSPRGKSLTSQEKAWNKSRSQVRARVEHGFCTIKHLWGYRKVRYKGLAKNQSQLFALFTLTNLYRARKSILLVQQRESCLCC